jgi:hypothetical protein
MALGSFESDQPMRKFFRGLGSFAGARASDDAKASFSSQLDSLKENIDNEAIAIDMIHVEAARMLRDLNQYDSWEESWAPVALGGYYSSSQIRSDLQGIMRRFPESVAREVSRATSGPGASADPIGASIAAPLPQVMEAPDTCEQDALDLFGPILGRSRVAQTWTCHKWKVIGGVIGIVVVIVMIYGFAAGLSTSLVKAVVKR